MKKVFMLRGNEMYRCSSFHPRGDYMLGRRCHVFCAEQTPILESNTMKSQGWRQEISDGGADSSDEGANIWFSGYYKRQKSPKKLLSTFRRGAIAP